jgi:hypothetical protein
MKSLTNLEKENTSGGIAPMMLWVGVMCVSTLISTVVNSVATLCSTNNTNNTTGSNKTASVANNTTGYLRVSPYPNRSSIMMAI